MADLDPQLDKFLRRQPKLGKNVYIAKTAVVIGDVTLGAHTSIMYGAVLRGDINRIVIGHHSNVQDNAVLHLADEHACVLGNWVTVGHGAIVHACQVGDEVLVGMGSVILDGAVIGKQSIVGAKALVTQGTKVPRARSCWARRPKWCGSSPRRNAPASNGGHKSTWTTAPIA